MQCNRLKRREFITLLGGTVAAWPLAARAQEQTVPVRQARIGVLAATPPTSAMLIAFREGMRQRGYIEGQNLSIDVRWPQGTFEQNPSIAADLASTNVEVIVAWSTPAVIAARRATSAIPIVMVSVGDPIGSGFVTSLARPGGNITGLSATTLDISAKIMGLLMEFVPGMKRVGVVGNAYNPNVAEQLRETEDAVGKMGLQSHVVEANTPEEYDRAFAHLSAERVDCVVVLGTPTVIEHAQRIAELARAARLPMRHLPTNGGGPALTAVLGNNSQVLVSSIAAASGQIKAGKLRALACFSAQRAASQPTVPTLKELGYDVEFSLWVGVFAPKKTPDAVIKVLREGIKEVATGDQFKTAITNIGDEVAYLDAPEFAKFWDEEAKRVEAAVLSIGRVQG